MYCFEEGASLTVTTLGVPLSSSSSLSLSSHSDVVSLPLHLCPVCVHMGQYDVPSCFFFFLGIFFCGFLCHSVRRGGGKTVWTNCMPCIKARVIDTSWATSMAFALRFFSAFVSQFIVLLVLLAVGEGRGLLLLILQFLSTLTLLSFANLFWSGVGFT